MGVMGSVASYLFESKSVGTDIALFTPNDHILFDRGIRFMVLCNHFRVFDISTGIIHDIWLSIIYFMMRIKVDDIVKDALLHGWELDRRLYLQRVFPKRFHYDTYEIVYMNIFQYTFPHYIFIKAIRHNKPPSHRGLEVSEDTKIHYGNDIYQHFNVFRSYYQTKHKLDNVDHDTYSKVIPIYEGYMIQRKPVLT